MIRLAASPGEAAPQQVCALWTDLLARRHAHTVEAQLCGVGALPAHLPQRAARQVRRIGYDKNLSATGVLIMVADDRIGESHHGFGPVRLVNADPTVPRLEGAALDVDRNAAFADENHGVRIRLLRKSGQSYEVLAERTRR